MSNTTEDVITSGLNSFADGNDDDDNRSSPTDTIKAWAGLSPMAKYLTLNVSRTIFRAQV
jgi:hypothetical protein